jgi:hypothetical protein
MTKLFRSSLVIVFLTAFSLFGFAPVAQAHSSNHGVSPNRTPSENATYQASKKLVAQGCKEQSVTLHGNTKNVPPSIVCADAKSTSGIQPNLSVAQNCAQSALILYKDEFGGGTLCFSGTGATDLTSYCLPIEDGGCLYNWNDEVTSFSTTSYTNPGSIYRDIGEAGFMTSFTSSTGAVDWAGTSNNDQASSVRI